MTNLIAFAGRIGSGKDTAAQIMKNTLGGSPITELKDILNPDYQWVVDSSTEWSVQKFAGKLKTIASILTGIPYQKFEDQDFKKSYLGPEWDEMQVRVFLQKLGTEAMRTGLHTDTWINATFSSFTKDSKWIITDCRFQNEFDAVKARGGKVIFIERGASDTGTHPSEVEMMQFRDKCDYHIYNNSDLAALEFNIGLVLKDNQLLPVVEA